jgi:hypothetical protein
LKKIKKKPSTTFLSCQEIKSYALKELHTEESTPIKEMKPSLFIRASKMKSAM